MKCVECFKDLPGDKFICDRCIAVKSGDLDHLDRTDEQEKTQKKRVIK